MKRLMFLVSLILIAGLGCIPSLAPPVIVALSITPEEITAGESATLLWNVTGATSVSIDKGIGTVGVAGTKVVSPSTTTVYTLTATNTAGTVSKSVVVNVVAPPPVSPPVIGTFMANPPEITVGDSVTLKWNVTGATSVNIDQGIGSVPAVGTIVVSPATTTVYILTAANAGGSTSQSLTVTVVAASPIDATAPTVPILSSPTNGATLPQPSSAWTFDWADATDPESGIKQYQIYVIRTGEVNPVIDGYVTASSYSKTLGGYIPLANLTGWKWKVRAQNNAGLWGAWSVQRTFDVEPRVAYNFVDKASTAYWWSTPGEQLPFPGDAGDNRGFARYWTNVTLNDGWTYAKVLETHPKWVDNGWISGKYSSVSVPEGAKLRVKVGIIEGAAAGKVKFQVAKLGEVPILVLIDAYAEGVKEMEVSLDAYAGQTIDFVLNVNAEGSSAQDWAAWAEAKIVY